MHVPLWIWDGEACFRQSLLHAVRKIPVDRPVVRGFRPWTADGVNRVLRQLVDSNGRLGIAQNQRVCPDNFLDDAERIGDQILIRDTEDQIDTPGITGGNIGDDIAPDVLVRDENDLIVWRDDRRYDDADGFNRTTYAPNEDLISLVKRAVDHQPACEVAQRILKGKCKDEGRTIDHRKERRNVDAERRQDE